MKLANSCFSCELETWNSFKIIYIWSVVLYPVFSPDLEAVINSIYGTDLDVPYSSITHWEITFYTRTNTHRVWNPIPTFSYHNSHLGRCLPLALIYFNRETNELLVKGDARKVWIKKKTNKNTAMGARLAAYQHLGSSKQNTRQWKTQATGEYGQSNC